VTYYCGSSYHWQLGSLLSVRIYTGLVSYFIRCYYSTLNIY